MNEGKIKQYDTVKDKDGNRYRVVEVGSDGKGHVIAKLKGITPDNKAKRGPARLVEVGELEASYTRIDLPPVTVVQPARPAENAMQKQREIVGEYAKKHVNVINELDEDDIIIKGLEEENEKLRKTIKELRAINEKWANSDERKMIEDLKDEIEVLKEDKKYIERQLELADQDVTEMKKTISKMKDVHDEEVRALEDELMEVKIVAKKAGQYSDALDDDSVVFGKIHMLATTLKGLATSIEGIALLIQDETEGKI